jgi:hypothetical protein
MAATAFPVKDRLNAGGVVDHLPRIAFPPAGERIHWVAGSRPAEFGWHFVWASIRDAQDTRYPTGSRPVCS